TSLFKAIEKEGLQGEKGDNNWVVRQRQIHDPGIQQEPTLNKPARPEWKSMTGGLMMGLMTGPVTLVLRRKVKAGREAENETWLAGGQEASARVARQLGGS